MPNPALPQNQINALPLQTAEQAVQAGDALVYGSPVTKFWSSVALGVTGIAASALDPLPAPSPFFGGENSGLHQVLPTLFIDPIGIGRFAIVVRRSRAALSGAGAAIALFRVIVQYRFDVAEIPPITRAPGQDAVIAQRNVNDVSYNFPGSAWPAMLSETTPQTVVIAWSPATEQPGDTVPLPIAIGRNVRFILTWLATPPLPNINDLWTVELWGSSV